jgi:hypothetical protein
LKNLAKIAKFREICKKSKIGKNHKNAHLPPRGGIGKIQFNQESLRGVRKKKGLGKSALGKNDFLGTGTNPTTCPGPKSPRFSSLFSVFVLVLSGYSPLRHPHMAAHLNQPSRGHPRP